MASASTGRLAALACALIAAACAEAPPRPEPAPVVRPSAPSMDPALARAVGRQKALAEREEAAGNLGDATRHWEAAALLDPDDARVREGAARVRTAAARVAADEVAAGQAAQKAGELERASAAYLRALAADPANAEAARQLREIERQRAIRTQADKSARAAANSGMTAVVPDNARRASAELADPYDLEQRIEMFRAGDTEGGLRELKRYVEAHSGDKPARRQIGTAVYERGVEREAQGAREEALTLYDQAMALRGEKPRDWYQRAETLRRALSAEYYDKGVAAWPSDPALAIRMWETSLRYDPRNAKASERLAQARKQKAGAAAARGS